VEQGKYSVNSVYYGWQKRRWQKRCLDILSQKLYTFCDKDEVIYMAQSIENKIVNRICRGSIFGAVSEGWFYT
jgi:hypothetical protein